MLLILTEERDVDCHNRASGQALPSHLLANVGPEPEEFPVDPVESRLQEVPLARVLRVEEIEQV